MRSLVASALSLSLLLPGMSNAASAAIDLNQKPKAFSAEDYNKLVACTIERHPDETRRYAAYHFLRRNQQTPDQNERDPDSGLMLPALKGCYEIKVGTFLPFQPDALAASWAKAHGVAEPRLVSTTEELAECAARYFRNDAKQFIRIPARTIESISYATRLIGPMCRTNGRIKIDVNVLRSELTRKLAETEVSAGEKN